MNKTAVLYVSVHHGNTKKVLDAMNQEHSIDLYPLEQADTIDLNQYDRIGFASGVYQGTVHPGFMKYITSNLEQLSSKNVFVIVTHGAGGAGPMKRFTAGLRELGLNVVGQYDCHGFDTYGIFGKVGGLYKKSPTKQDCERARTFYDKVVKSH